MKFTYNSATAGLYAASGGLYYYLSPASGTSLPTADISFQDSWYAYNGFYLFLDSTNQASIISAITGENPPAALTPFQDERHALWLNWLDSAVAVIGKITFRANQWNSFGTVTQVSQLGIGQYTMPLEPGMMIYPTANGTLLAPADFDSATHFSFLHPESKNESDFTQHAVLNESGTPTGALTALGMICDFSDDSASGWDVGFRYFFEDKGEVASQFFPIFENPQGTYVVFNMQWDLFNPLNADNSYLQFTGDQFTLTEQSGSYQLSDVPNTPTLPVIPTFFRTRLGQQLTLTPDATSLPKLVFQSKSIVGNDYYLVPSGSFTVDLIGLAPPGPNGLLCGLTGTEFIGFNAGDYFQFVPGKNAVAAAFPVSSVTNNSTAKNPLPDPAQEAVNTPTTAWVQIQYANTAAAPTTPYFSQPESSPLYQQLPAGVSGTPNATDDPAVFAYQEVYCQPILNVGTGGTSTLPTSDQAFPMVPYSGLTSALDSIPFQWASSHLNPQDFEAQVLSPVRKEQLSPSAALAAGSNPITTITPTGLLVTLDEDTAAWSQVTLANNTITQITGYQTGGTPITATTSYSLGFNNITQPLVNAFQSNQQFMVISSSQNLCSSANAGHPVPPGTLPPSLTEAWFANEMSIEGWPFIFKMPTTAQSGSYSNVMIIKFCNGTLLDFLKTPQTWTQGAALNGVTKTSDLVGLSAWMSNYVAAGIQAYEDGDEDFAQFAQIAQDADWQGVIGLNMDIAIHDFPPQLDGLLAGIDESKFKAHHFGVQMNQPKLTTAKTLEIGAQSKLFGLINYTSPALTQPTDPTSDFDFRVLLLKVVFQNSKITNFKGQIQLMVNKLFGSKVSHTTALGQQISSNSLFFNSGFEVHDGVPVYTFTDLQDTRFYMANNVLDYVEITKATFKTILPKSVAGVTQINVQSRFTMWGYMGFAPQMYTAVGGTLTQAADLLSFGEDVGATDPRTGLSFNNLLVDMDFPAATPTAVTFAAETAHLEFDKALNTVRTGSLADQLPTTTVSLISGKKGESVSQYGFVPMEVRVPNVQWENPSDDWVGLTFDISLGSLGALGGKMNLTAKLLLAWGVNSRPDSYAFAAGLALPGVNSKGQLFNLEGILKLTMDGIKLIGAVNHDGEMGYLIQISDIALKFMGVKLPPGATTEFFIFGDPAGVSVSDKIGWYGAFTQNT